MEKNFFWMALSWFFQVIAGSILAYASYGKIVGDPTSSFIFASLEMGSQGRFLIGVLEVFASILLLTPFVPHWGALLGFSLMLGALIAHFTRLGIEVNGDGGRMFTLLLVVLFSTVSILFIRRRRLPFIGPIIY